MLFRSELPPKFPGVQEYKDAPVALKLAVSPKQMAVDDALLLSTGFESTVMLAVADALQPLVFVPVTV